MIRALIFDFDGLILDTESPEFESWQEIFTEYGCCLSVAQWGVRIGTADGALSFDPFADLEAQLGRAVDRQQIRLERRTRNTALVEAQRVLPGVESYIAEARRSGLKLSVASSSPHDWVDRHLVRLGLWPHFDCVKCGDDVHSGKPDPAVYLAAIEALGVRPDEALALEDSPNGLRAAKRAGLLCVVVPNSVTRQLSFDGADLLLDSLAQIPLADLLAQVQLSRNFCSSRAT